jgi:tetratricopeptide (TPR) repeat protein
MERLSPLSTKQFERQRFLLCRVTETPSVTKLLSLFFLLILGLSIAYAQSHEWTDWVSKGKMLNEAANYPEAAKAFRQALATASSSNVSDMQLAGIMSALAGAYADLGQYSDAEHEWRRAMVIVERVQGPSSLAYSLLLGSVSELPTQVGKRNDVIAVLRNSLIANRQTGSTRDLALIRGFLAQILIEEKRYPEAEAILLDSEFDSEELKRTSPLLAVKLLNYFAMLRYNQGRFLESANLASESIHRVESSMGVEDSSLLGPLNNLAVAFVKIDRLEDAGTTLKRATAVCERSLGGDHPSCGILLGNYSFILNQLGRRREAKQMARHSRQIQQASDRRNGNGVVIHVRNLRQTKR